MQELSCIVTLSGRVTVIEEVDFLHSLLAGGGSMKIDPLSLIWTHTS